MNSPENTLTQSLITLIREKPVAAGDLHQTALFTLDAIANTIAGRNSEPGRKLLEWGKGRMNDTGRRAFVMGGLTHILEVDDVHRASVVHTGAVTVPAVFALAAGRDLPGEALLRAVMHGFESACRVGMAVGPAHYRVWHNTATCGPFGSAMSAATVLGLDDDQAMHALGNAGTQSGGVWEFLKTGAMSKHLHAGRAAEAGVVAAELAELGFTGPPAILEGPTGFFAAACPDPDPDAVLRDPDAPWQVHLTSIKPWPSCRHTHPAIDASLALAGQIDLSAVKSIHVATYAAALDVCDRPVANTDYEAKFSLQHCVAAALQRGDMNFAAFGDAARAQAMQLTDKIRLTSAEPYATAYPVSWGAGISVELEDGTKIESTKDECKGDPVAALSDDEMISKARDLMRFGGVNDSARVIDGIMNLSNGGSLPELESFFASAG
ncbi:MAG: MmgE/PrpD family protein [Rhodospirillaceae bacterium]|jgi:2-methylcitrate dehydratase PrpD|nr:MmgE/PrpD family protein [Rhodospirillaceae bacterium]MBT5457636.1 MmgE/PrpD family protein [Rhodospirillaceae bacterium]